MKIHPFGTYEKCPKDQSGKVARVYCPTVVVTDTNGDKWPMPEYLCCTCRTCGFVWNEYCADFTPAPDPLLVTRPLHPWDIDLDAAPIDYRRGQEWKRSIPKITR